MAGWTTYRSTGLHFFCQSRKPPFSPLIERLTSFWHCNMTRFMLQDMPFRCGHFLLVDLVKPSCARIGGLTTSAVYGVDLNFRPLSLIRGFCIGLLIHKFVIETDSPCLIAVIHLPPCVRASIFPWSPFSSSPPPCQINTPCRAVRSQHGTLGWLWFSVGGSSGLPALNISLPCMLISFPLCNRLMHIHVV